MRESLLNLNRTQQIHPNIASKTVTRYLFSSSTRDDIHYGDHQTPMPYKSRFTWMKGSLALYAQTEVYWFDRWMPDGDGAIGVNFNGTPLNPSITDPFSLTVGSTREADVLRSSDEVAMNKVLKYIDEITPSWDVLTDAAESHQVFHMVSDLSQRLRWIFSGVLTRSPRLILRGFGLKPTTRRRRAVKKKLILYSKKSTSWTVFDSVGDLYLCYRYGITPLLHSLDDAINVFGKALWVPDVRIPFVKGSKAEITTTNRSTVRDNTVAADVTTIRENYGYVTYRGSFSFQDSIRQRVRSCVPLQAAATAWELVPWSFVVDWFISIGGWIQKLVASEVVANSCDMFRSLYVTVTERKTLSNIRAQSDYGLYRLRYMTFLGESIEAQTTVFTRERAVLTVPPPRFEIGFSSNAITHAMDSLFLLLGVVKRSRAQSYSRPSLF